MLGRKYIGKRASGHGGVMQNASRSECMEIEGVMMDTKILGKLKGMGLDII